ncbi:MAG TPA: lipase family protein [Mycobacteriales bacterium]|nr:lipase family protein [Mycobacteriales bacterium]HWC34195.1 lipase family protein [Mycobacteriales bacterium]
MTPSRRITVIAAAGSVAVMLAFGTAVAQPAAPVTAAASVPMPEADPFYTVPANIGDYHDGQVVRSRPIQAQAWAVPMPGRAWQLLYRTEDFRGRPTATVTTVLVPSTPWQQQGRRPIISYQTAEDGVAGKCSPSYSLRAGAHAGFENSTAETSEMYLALEQGWALSVPDYEGPRSTFLIAATEAHGVLDGIRAARNFSPAHVSRAAPVGLWGYSGGSFASVVAAEYQPTYAAGLRLRAIALGGLVGGIRASINDFSGSVAGGAIPMGINGFLRAYPKLHLLQYLNATGRRDVAATSRDCIDEAVSRYPFLSIEQIEARPHALDSKPVARMLWRNSPLGIRGTPTAPIYDYHADGDELAPIKPALRLLHRFCRSGVVVQHVQSPVGEHLSEVATGAPGAMRFFTSRFAGKPPIDTCASMPWS